MALARHWRIKNIAVTGTQLEISDFQFGYTAVAVTGGTLSSNIAPTTGVLSSFSDGNPANVCSWPVADLATLAISWDFGTPVEITQIRQAFHVNLDQQIDWCTMESSADGVVWTTVDVDRWVPQTDVPDTYATWIAFTTQTPVTAYKVSGQVVDDTGSPLEAVIRVYDRTTGALIGTSTSDSVTGVWWQVVPTIDPVFVVRFKAPVILQIDPFVLKPGLPTGNADIYDNVTPVFFVPDEVPV